MVNKILKAVLGYTMGANPDLVPSVEAALRAANDQTSQPQQGDIDVQGQDGHIGICANAGCTLVFSNSSSEHCFCDESNPTFSGPNWPYSPNVQPRFYHIP